MRTGWPDSEFPAQAASYVTGLLASGWSAPECDIALGWTGWLWSAFHAPYPVNFVATCVLSSQPGNCLIFNCFSLRDFLY
jgi:hypothetical protein